MDTEYTDDYLIDDQHVIVEEPQPNGDVHIYTAPVEQLAAFLTGTSPTNPNH
jgi:hypothetical protein